MRSSPPACAVLPSIDIADFAGADDEPHEIALAVIGDERTSDALLWG
jgi:hypothetical protein